MNTLEDWRQQRGANSVSERLAEAREAKATAKQKHIKELASWIDEIIQLSKVLDDMDK